MSDSKSFFEDVLNIYGAKASDTLAGLLNNEHFVRTIEKVLSASLTFKDFMQSSIRSALTQLNLPTRDDLEQVMESQRALEERLAKLEEAIERLPRVMQTPAKPKPPAKKKAASKT